MKTKLLLLMICGFMLPSLSNAQTFYGVNAGLGNTGSACSGFGAYVLSGVNGISYNSGNYNAGIGEFSLYANESGYDNTAVGSASMFYNVSGQDNTGIGYVALTNNESGSYNTAVGSQALSTPTSCSYNVAIGYQLCIKALRVVIAMPLDIRP